MANRFMHYFLAAVRDYVTPVRHTAQPLASRTAKGAPRRTGRMLRHGYFAATHLPF